MPFSCGYTTTGNARRKVIVFILCWIEIEMESNFKETIATGYWNEIFVNMKYIFNRETIYLYSWMYFMYAHNVVAIKAVSSVNWTHFHLYVSVFFCCNKGRSFCPKWSQKTKVQDFSYIRVIPLGRREIAPLLADVFDTSFPNFFRCTFYLAKTCSIQGRALWRTIKPLLSFRFSRQTAHFFRISNAFGASRISTFFPFHLNLFAQPKTIYLYMTNESYFPYIREARSSMKIAND